MGKGKDLEVVETDAPSKPVKKNKIERVLDWDEAEEHLHEVEQRYLNVMGLPGVNVSFFFLHVLTRIRGRWNAGVRDEKLFDEIMALE